MLAAYAALVFAGLFRHEMWRDELHAWLIASGSGDLADLYRNTRYDGHPPLWTALVFLVSRFTADPFWMQMLHGALAVAAAAVFVRYAPMPLWLRALFLAGYFPLYEYAIVSRDTACAMLWLFTACALRPTRYRSPWPSVGALSALGLSSPHGLLVAGALAAGWAVEDHRDIRARRRAYVAPALALAAAMAFAAWYALPPADADPLLRLPKLYWSSALFSRTALGMWHAYWPVCEWRYGFW